LQWALSNAVAGGGSLLLFSALLAVGFSPHAMNVTNSVIQCPRYVSLVLGSRRELRGQQGWVLSVVFLPALSQRLLRRALGVILIAILTLVARDDLRRLNTVYGVLSLIISVAVFTIGAPVGWPVVALLAPPR
jgi:uncharacterized membrane protein YfcA